MESAYIHIQEQTDATRPSQNQEILMNALRTFGKLFAKSDRGSNVGNVSRRNGRSLPELERLGERLMPSLTPIGYNAGYPYSAIVEIQTTFPDGKSFVSSGALIDTYHVLTAAHVLYSYADGGFAKSIEVVPDLYGSYAPRGTAYATYERVDPSWIAFNEANPGETGPSVVDVGLITLNSQIGTSTGSLGLSYNNNNAFFTNQYFETAGYPASYGYSGKQMYYSYGRITGESGTDLLSTEGNITIVPGQSGSPLFNPSTDVIYGVVSGYNGNTNSTTEDFVARITQSIFSEIETWRSEDRAPAAAVQLSTTALNGLKPAATTSTGKTQSVADASVSITTPSFQSATPIVNAVSHGPAMGTSHGDVVDAIFSEIGGYQIDLLKHDNA
jgi:V8-like Glu-specific endopeptidase